LRGDFQKARSWLKRGDRMDISNGARLTPKVDAPTDFLRSCTILNVGQFLSAMPSKGKTGSKNKHK